MKAQWLSIKELGGSEEEVKALLNKVMKEKTPEDDQGCPDLRRKNFYRILSSGEEVLKQNH